MALALCLGTSVPGGAAARAQGINPDPDAARGSEKLRDATSLCVIALFQPEQTSARAVALKYNFERTAAISSVMKSTGYAKDGVSLIITDINFSDERVRSCQISSALVLSIDGVIALKAHLESDPAVGPLDGASGKTPMGSGEMILGNYKRPGLNPLVHLNVVATPTFANIFLNRADLIAR